MQQERESTAEAREHVETLTLTKMSMGTFLNWRSGVWLPHMRWLTILHRAMDLSARPAQPRFRQISNRQRIRRPALCVTYTMSVDSARPSSFSREMYACSVACYVSSATPHIFRITWQS